MKDIQAAVAAYLEQAVGVPAVEERSRCRGNYPMLAVTVRENGTVLLAGGRLAEHEYLAEVTAASDREREEASLLLDAVTAALLRGVPMGERVLHPLDIKTEGDKLTFALAVCRVVPQSESGETPAELMESIHVEVK